MFEKCIIILKEVNSGDYIIFLTANFHSCEQIITIEKEKCSNERDG